MRAPSLAPWSPAKVARRAACHAWILISFDLPGCASPDTAADEPPQAPAMVSATGNQSASADVPTSAPAASGGDPTDRMPPMPAPRRGRLSAAVAQNATCLSCHVEEAEEWRASRHRQSDTNSAYRRAFAVEPTAFCRGCHAPEANPMNEPPPAVSAMGVGCVTCHVTEEGVVLAGPAGADRPDPSPAPHPLRRTAALGSDAGCVACHEFRFPGVVGDEDGRFMQTTVREHARSKGAGQPCTACHMPRNHGRRSHTFGEVRDRRWLAGQLDVSVERSGDRLVRITLAQRAPGHAFPTGDLFRRLLVGCELRGPGGAVVGRSVRALARHFEIRPGAPGRALVRDDRVFDEPTVVELEIDGEGPVPRGARLSWWVHYQRVATVGAGTDPRQVVLESEVPLHSGTLAWEAR